jgi:hypothetical protein
MLWLYHMEIHVAMYKLHDDTSELLLNRKITIPSEVVFLFRQRPAVLVHEQEGTSPLVLKVRYEGDAVTCNLPINTLRSDDFGPPFNV